MKDLDARGQLSPQGSEHGDLPRQPPVERKHRLTCASRWVFVSRRGKATSCGMPCDCDNPGKLVEIPCAE